MGNPETWDAEVITKDDVGVITMDDIWTQGVDQDKVNETARSMLLARGPYVTIPPMTVSGQRFEASGDKPARLLYRAYGRIVWAGQEAPVHKGQNGDSDIAADEMGRISFSFSPDQVIKTRADGKVGLDLASKLYVMLVKAYTVAYGQVPTSAQDLKTYLESYPVKLTVGTIGEVDVRNMVFGIGPVRG